jgi:hypothetical protein
MRLRRLRGGLIAAATVVLLVSIAWAISLARELAPADAAAYENAARPGRGAEARPRQHYVSPSGSDAAPCTEAAPCASLDRAYRRARPGHVVVMAAGTYPAQTIEPKPLKRAGPNVVIRPAPGARVVIDGALVVRASRLELRGLTATRWESVSADHQIFRDMDVGVLYIKGSTHVSVIGGDVGPYENDDSQIKSHEGRVPANLLFDGVYFHDAIKENPKAHTECLQFGSGIGVVIRRSRFERCANHDIFIRSWGTANGTAHPLRDFTIENNFFGKTTSGYYSLRLAAQEGWPCERFLIRNNSALQNMYSDCEARDVRFLANIQPSQSRRNCERSDGGVWDWNVYGDGQRCGAHDIVRRTRFRNPDDLDLHLTENAAAVGRGARGSVPAEDIDGQARPLGEPDAGADER